MKIITQNVKKAVVTIDGRTFSQIGKGLLVFIGIEEGDTRGNAEWMANKILHHRMFKSEDKVTSNSSYKSVEEIEGQILVVSQFTICANNRKGTKPSFSHAMQGENAREIYKYFINVLKNSSNLDIQTGKFAAYMQIELINDGPFTLLFEKNAN